MKDHKGLAIILGRLGKDKHAEDSDGGDEDNEYTAAAQEVMDALKAEDAGAFADALKSFVTMCHSEE